MNPESVATIRKAAFVREQQFKLDGLILGEMLVLRREFGLLHPIRWLQISIMIRKQLKTMTVRRFFPVKKDGDETK